MVLHSGVAMHTAASVLRAPEHFGARLQITQGLLPPVRRGCGAAAAHAHPGGRAAGARQRRAAARGDGGAAPAAAGAAGEPLRGVPWLNCVVAELVVPSVCFAACTAIPFPPAHLHRTHPPTPRLAPQFGYISLFPLLMRLIPADSPVLGRQLELLRDDSRLWTDYGLRSLRWRRGGKGGVAVFLPSWITKGCSSCTWRGMWWGPVASYDLHLHCSPPGPQPLRQPVPAAQHGARPALLARRHLGQRQLPGGAGALRAGYLPKGRGAPVRRCRLC